MIETLANATEMPEDLIGTKEAAAILGINHATLSTWRSKGRGPRYFQYARTVLYSKAEIEAFKRSAWVCPPVALVAE